MPGPAPGGSNDQLAGVDEMLEVVRRQLAMDVAFISRLSGDTRTFRNIRSAVDLPIEVGHVEQLAGTYCQMITEGDLGQVVPDTSDEPLTKDAWHTSFLGIGSYIGVPMRRADGSLYGTLCAFSRRPEPALRRRDAAVLSAMAALVITLIEAEDDAAARRARLDAAVDRAVAGGTTIRWEPVVRLADRSLAGQEAVVRLADGADPADRVAQAREVGRALELEGAFLRGLAAVVPAGDLPTWWRLSAASLAEPFVHDLLRRCDPARLVVVVSALEVVRDHEGLAETLQPLRRDGLRLCVDQMGHAGTGMDHVLMLEPEVIGVAPRLVRDLGHDRHRQAVVETIAALADRLDASSVATGLGSADDVRWSHDLGVTYGRGPALGPEAAQPARGAPD